MVLGTVSVIGGLSVLMLPETGSHLSDTLEEVEECIAWVSINLNGVSNLALFNQHCVCFSVSNSSQRKYIETISSNIHSTPAEKE